MIALLMLFGYIVMGSIVAATGNYFLNNHTLDPDIMDVIAIIAWPIVAACLIIFAIYSALIWAVRVVFQSL